MQVMIKHFSVVAALLLFLVAGSPPADAQTQANWQSGRPQMTRVELNDLLVRLEAMTQGTAYSSEIRNKAQAEAAMVRARLEQGDIRVGDQIALVVEGEDSLTNTFTVRPGEILSLPGIGDIPVGGVLRSELEPHLAGQLSRYIRNPVVRAQSLVRVTIAGSVMQPGFYAVQPDRLLSDAIMQAGGPAVTANLNHIRIERAGREIWSGAYLQQAIADGRTLDQLSLQAGDQIIIPAHRPGILMAALPYIGGVASLLALVLTIVR